MPASPQTGFAASQFGPYDVFVRPGQAAFSSDLEPGERLGGPVARKRSRVLRGLVLLALSGTGVWAWLQHSDDVVALATRVTGMVQEFQQRRLPQAQAEAPAPAPAPLPSLGEKDVAAAAPLAAEPLMRQPAVPEADAAVRPEEDDETSAKQASPERLPAVVADPADALLQRALAAGLHPALSRTLLESLTPDDFRNAAHAVRAALGHKLGAEPVLWPRRRAAGLAQFKVKRVEGAPACRRYVVQIAKDGWETTARPMEQCQASEASKPT